jgi:hypothetical protein
MSRSGSVLAVAALGLTAVAAGLPCAFHAVFGIRCPFCGMTRATLALAHGDLGASLAAHPLAPLVLLGTAWAVWLLFRGRRPPVSAPVILGALGVVWAVNLIAH